jgi:hypothetical protein
LFDLLLFSLGLLKNLLFQVGLLSDLLIERKFKLHLGL